VEPKGVKLRQPTWLSDLDPSTIGGESMALTVKIKGQSATGALRAAATWLDNNRRAILQGAIVHASEDSDDYVVELQYEEILSAAEFSRKPGGRKLKAIS